MDEVVSACVPAVEANYPGGVVDPLPTGFWLQGDMATVELQTYVGTVSWTTTTDFTFPALCTIAATEGSGPTVTYVGVADR